MMLYPARRMMYAGNATPPAPVYEAFTWQAAGDPDEPDVAYNLGVQHAVTALGLFYGVRVLIPTTPPGAATVALWNEDTATLLASQAFTPGPGGVEQDVLFASPVAASPGVNYVSGWNTTRQTFTASYPWPATTTHMSTAGSMAGRFRIGALALPTSATSASYNVGPLYIAY